MRPSPVYSSPDGRPDDLRRWVSLLSLGMVLGALLMAGATSGADGLTSVPASGVKIKKVLPHWLDKQGRHLLSPSLLERDAYQAILRKEPERRGGLRFDIQCGTLPSAGELVLKLEIRGSKDNTPTWVNLEQVLSPKTRFHRWKTLALAPEQYQSMGELVAWRASLWSASQLIAEQKSFLW